MKYEKVVKAKFISRPNRFIANVIVSDESFSMGYKSAPGVAHQPFCSGMQPSLDATHQLSGTGMQPSLDAAHQPSGTGMQSSLDAAHQPFNTGMQPSPVAVHVKNTGRCKELLVPGCTVYLEDFAGRMGTRKLRYSLIAVEKPQMPVERPLHMADSNASCVQQSNSLEYLSRNAKTLHPLLGETTINDSSASNSAPNMRTLLINMDSQAPNKVVLELLFRRLRPVHNGNSSLSQNSEQLINVSAFNSPSPNSDNVISQEYDQLIVAGSINQSSQLCDCRISDDMAAAALSDIANSAKIASGGIVNNTSLASGDISVQSHSFFLNNDFQIIKPESVFGDSRFDFYLKDAQGREGYLEVKGCTLEEDGIASFPDAPTERGVKHIRELIKAKEAGYHAGLLFVVQMEGMGFITPNDRTHKAFGDALRDAEASGVDIVAVECHVTPDSLTITRPIKVVSCYY